jgi:HSP20 family protein
MFLRLGNRAYPPNQLRQEMNRLFDDFFDQTGLRDPFGMTGRGTFPALNVWEKGDRLLAEAEVPGLSMDDLEIFVSGNELTVRGERRPVHPEGASYHRRERGVGSFTRAVRLPVDVDAGKVQARLNNGVLTITLPKSQAAQPRKIEVKSA